MVPAHHVTTLRLVGCPDPNPGAPAILRPAARHAARPTSMSSAATTSKRCTASCAGGSRRRIRAAPIGVPFSGGIDSGAVLLCLYKLLLERRTVAGAAQGVHAVGRRRRRRRAAGARIPDARRVSRCSARSIDVPSSALDPLRAVAVIEDYKPLDVECAAVNLALLAGIRERYPDWRLLVDGDGGDENLKDYPIEENSELTIRSVVNNRMLYQEGWGVDSIKHSLTYSGGYSRGCVRSYACAREHGFDGFSPYTRPSRDRGGRGDSVRRADGGLARAAVRAQGRDRLARRSLGARTRDARLSQAALPARLGLGRARSRDCFRRTRRATAATSRRCTPPRCERVGRRPADPEPAPAEARGRSVAAHGSLVEEERRPDGRIERALTVFLAGAECPFTCSFCDLWRCTIDGPTPPGALTGTAARACSQRSTDRCAGSAQALQREQLLRSARRAAGGPAGDRASWRRRSRRDRRVAREHDRSDARWRSRGMISGTARSRRRTRDDPSRRGRAAQQAARSRALRSRGALSRRARHRPARLRAARCAVRAGRRIGRVDCAHRGVCGRARRVGRVDHPGARRKWRDGAARGARAFHAADAVAARGRARPVRRTFAPHRRHRRPLGCRAARRLRPTAAPARIERLRRLNLTGRAGAANRVCGV